MRPSNPACLALGAILFAFSFPAFAQTGGGGHSSASSQAHYASGAGSFAPPTGSVHPSTGTIHPPTGAPIFGSLPRSTERHHAGSHKLTYFPHYYPYFNSPYAADDNNTDTSPQDDSAEYQGGPTIFDRRGSGSPAYQDSANNESPRDINAKNDSSVSADTEPPQPPTELVFKDGHQLEVDNYAIVNQTLFDLSPGHVRKIALADLDLAATEKQNDDRGVMFQLPPTLQAN